MPKRMNGRENIRLNATGSPLLRALQLQSVAGPSAAPLTIAQKLEAITGRPIPRIIQKPIRKYYKNETKRDVVRHANLTRIPSRFDCRINRNWFRLDQSLPVMELVRTAIGEIMFRALPNLDNPLYQRFANEVIPKGRVLVLTPQKRMRSIPTPNLTAMSRRMHERTFFNGDVNNPLSMLPANLIHEASQRVIQCIGDHADSMSDLYNTLKPSHCGPPRGIPIQHRKVIIHKYNSGLIHAPSPGLPNPQLYYNPPRPQTNDENAIRQWKAECFRLKHCEMIQNYIIYGTGIATKALNTTNNNMYLAHALSARHASDILKVMNRVDGADQIYRAEIVDDLCEKVVPSQSELIRCSEDRFILFVPYALETLDTYLAEKLDQITEKEVIELFKQVVEITDFCHSLGLLVSDFKPKNFVFYTNRHGEKKLRLECFHKVRYLEDPKNDAVKFRFVMPGFTPPEMLNTAAEDTYNGKPADMWMMGILLYIMITGKYPFFDEVPANLFAKIRHGRFLWPLNYVHRHNLAIVHQLLNPDFNKRITTKDIIDMDLSGRDIRCRSQAELYHYEAEAKLDVVKSLYTRFIVGTYQNRRNNLQAVLPMLLKLSYPLIRELEGLLLSMPQSYERMQDDLQNIHSKFREQLENPKTRPRFHQKLLTDRVYFIQNLITQNQRLGPQKAVKIPAKLNGEVDLSKLPLELVLPPSLYPPRPGYHPNQNPLDAYVYAVLVDSKATGFKNFCFEGRKFGFDDIVIFNSEHQVYQPHILTANY